MKRLRTAIIGLGRVGWQFHLQEAARHQGLEVAAVVDPLPERREEARAKFGARGYPDHRALLAAEALDLVVIASPTQFHAEQALAAFEAGCDVFCDKPLAPSLAEADRMIAAAQQHGRKLTVYQPHRGRVETVALQDILRRGLLGAPYLMKRAEARYVRRNDWQAFRAHGGGMLNNYGAHYIDQLLYVAGSPAKRIRCVLRTIASLGDAEDVVKALIETESGVMLDVDINMAAAQEMSPWQVLGARGSATLDLGARAWRVRYYLPEELPPQELHEGLAAPGREYPRDPAIPWREETFPLANYAGVDFYEECYRFFALGEPPFVPIEASRELMRVLEACRADAG